MSLAAGIVGLPNVGKSSLFNALTKGHAPSENFPFCTIEPQVGVVAVPDHRLERLASLVKPKRVVPASACFVDIAGLIKGASEGEGLGNRFLSHIREVKVVVHVLRCFRDSDIHHVAGGVDPLFDKEIVDQELQKKDLETLSKRAEKLKKSHRASPKQAQEELDLLRYCQQSLTQGTPIRKLELKEEQRKQVEQWFLLTAKPVLYIANIDEETLLGEANPHLVRLQEALAQEGGQLLALCSPVEAQLALMQADERADFLAMYGLEESGLAQLIRRVYNLLGLMTYFTAGEQEVRAWEIRKGTQAPQAAGVIHTDLERGFIRAEVIKLTDYWTYKSEKGCRQAGKIASEGKQYEVEDGDVIHFLCKS